MSKRCKRCRKKWCGKRRAFGDGPLCFGSRKCRDKAKRKAKKQTTVWWRYFLGFNYA